MGGYLGKAGHRPGALGAVDEGHGGERRVREGLRARPWQGHCRDYEAHRQGGSGQRSERAGLNWVVAFPACPGCTLSRPRLVLAKACDRLCWATALEPKHKASRKVSGRLREIWHRHHTFFSSCCAMHVQVGPAATSMPGSEGRTSSRFSFSVISIGSKTQKACPRFLSRPLASLISQLELHSSVPRIGNLCFACKRAWSLMA